MKVCWNLTNLCNENCFYCFRELNERPKSLYENGKIVEKLNSLGVTRITYAGGEPFLYKGLNELLQYSSFLGIENAIITNGKCLTKDNLDEYLPYIKKITFSIDSPSEYVNESLGRGIDHYKHIKEILPYIRDYYPNIIIEVNTVASKDNIKELDFMFEALGSEISVYGLKKWKISRFCPLRGYAKERKSIYNLTDEEFKSIEEKYDGITSPFEVSVRNTNSIDENLIITPAGSLTKSNNNVETVLIKDILMSSEDSYNKVLGGK